MLERSLTRVSLVILLLYPSTSSVESIPSRTALQTENGSDGWQNSLYLGESQVEMWNKVDRCSRGRRCQGCYGSFLPHLNPRGTMVAHRMKKHDRQLHVRNRGTQRARTEIGDHKFATRNTTAFRKSCACFHSFSTLFINEMTTHKRSLKEDRGKLSEMDRMWGIWIRGLHPEMVRSYRVDYRRIRHEIAIENQCSRWFELRRSDQLIWIDWLW